MQLLKISENSSLVITNMFTSEMSRSIYEHLDKSCSWYQDEYNFSGRIVKSPRFVALMGEKSYFYSGINHIPEPWNETVTAIRDYAIFKFKDLDMNLEYNGVLLNKYRDGKDSLSMHSDREPAVDISMPIMSINFGASRNFKIVHQATGTRHDVMLNDGDALLMLGNFQDECKHGLDKEPWVTEPRINLTFRKFK